MKISFKLASVVSTITTCFTNIVINPARKVRNWFHQAVPNDVPSRPTRKSARIAVIMFLAFCVFSVIMVAKPNNTVVLACGIPYGIAYVAFVAWILFRFSRSKYTRPLRINVINSSEQVRRHTVEIEQPQRLSRYWQLQL
jgi:hypothetical protein